MKTVIITNPEPIDGEINQIHQLFKTGLEVMHIRKPAYLEQEYFDFIQQIDSSFHDRLVICSFHEEGLKMGFIRFHFSRTDYLNVRSYDEYENCILSTSTHSIEEFNKLHSKIDYAFLSPVFPSISKEGYYSQVDLIREIPRRTNFKTKLLALGGITEENTLQALKNGFDGVAMMGAIWIKC